MANDERRKIAAIIYFLHEYLENVRSLPLKLFPDLEQRERLVTVMQEALDRAIAKEEELEELEGEEEDDDSEEDEV